MDSHMHAYAEWLASRLRYLSIPMPALLEVTKLPWGDMRDLADMVEARREAKDLLRRMSGPLSVPGMGS